ncbi:hypothetical protein [Tenacibaculum sp. 190524A02b]|uniref:Uncharacterized protein n=1 Tax=Tenacibaculum vairaonense TaxID=3137860 RepID=A0ABP1FAF3_9FLAO
MNRKEFLIAFWGRIIRPLLLLIVVFYIAKFLFFVLKNDGFERSFVYFVVDIFILIHLFRFIFKSLLLLLFKIEIRIPSKLKFYLRIVGKFITPVISMFVGVLLYKMWLKDKMETVMMLVIMGIMNLREIYKEEKKKTRE